MILKLIKKLMLPSGDVSVGSIQPFVKRPAVGSTPTPGATSRRTFFSFFGTGVAMLAKPDLFVPKPYQLGDYLIPLTQSVHIGWNGIEQEWQFWAIITGKEPLLHSVVPTAADGSALFSPTPLKVDWKEDRELRKLAGW